MLDVMSKSIKFDSFNELLMKYNFAESVTEMVEDST